MVIPEGSEATIIGIGRELGKVGIIGSGKLMVI